MHFETIIEVPYLEPYNAEKLTTKKRYLIVASHI